MIQSSEKAFLGLDTKGSYWIIHNQVNSTASTVIINKTGPSFSLEGLLGTKGGSLQSERLQEFKALRFEKTWYLEDIQAFEAACGVTCAPRLRENKSSGSKLTRWDWGIEGIDLTRGLLEGTRQAPPRAKASPMSKRSRDFSPEPQPWSKRRPLDKDTPYFGHADTYRPFYGSNATDAPPPSAKKRRDSSFSVSSSPRDREVHDVGKSRLDNRHDQLKRPMQQPRQTHTSTANVSLERRHENADAATKRPSGADRHQNHADSTSVSFDYSGVPRGPRARPRLPQAPDYQQKLYRTALDGKHAGVVSQEELVKIKEQPYIFIASSHLPFLPTTIPHLQRRVLRDSLVSAKVKADVSGYYLVFPATKVGKERLQLCFERYNKSPMFGEYTLHMEAFVHGQTTEGHLPSEIGGNLLQTTTKPQSRPESLLGRPVTPVGGPAASHLWPKADDEVSMSSTAVPSEISSGTTSAKSHCAECKNSHFSPYNPKHGCSTCWRYYHSNCRKPQARINEDLNTWQCNYCIKKKRPKPAPQQRSEQDNLSASSAFEPSRLHNWSQDSSKQAIGQTRMGIWAPSTIAEIKGVQNSIPEPPVAAEETQSQRVILDPRFRGREFNGYSRLWYRTMNGTASTPEAHKHTLEVNLANEQQSTAPENSKLLPGVGDIRHRLQSSTGFQKEPDAPTQNRADQAPRPDANPSTEKAGPEKAYQPQDDTREVRTIDDDSMSEFSESKIDEYLDDDGFQADLEPEIPDLALEIPEVSTEDIASHGAQLQDKAEKLDVELFGGKHAQVVSSENRTSQNKHHPAKRSSLANCSVCGKIIFSKLAKVDDPTCIGCKNKRQTAEENSAPTLLITESPEEVWRRRLQPVQQHPSPAGDIRAPQPIREMPRFGQVHQNLHADLSTQDTEVAVSPENICIPQESLSEDERNGLPERYQTATNKAHTTVGYESEEEVETADQSAETADGEGQSSEASRPARRARSPVNENINNATAGMGSDNARSAIGSEVPQGTHGKAERDAQSDDAPKDSSNLPAPCAKLPAIFSWPELIGFALAETSDHRMTAAQVHQWIVDNIQGYDIHNTTHRSSIAATLSQQKAKFPKADAVMEGSRQLSRWRLAPEYVSAYKNELKNHRERLRRERELQGARNGLVSRRKEFNEFAKSPHTAPDPSNPRPTSQHKDISNLPPPSTETPMFIQRHRVAYDDDGRDIVAGFKDVPTERWTELAKAESFRTKGMRFYVGDYIKAPLPNRFKFADYSHKPLVQTIAQIEEIRQRRDASGYAVLVQWFVTKEAAEWWKCRHVKSLWPKDEKAGSYVPATVWDVLTSDFIIEQEKLDPEETKRRIIPNLFFELDTEVWLLYLKQGQGPETWPGIAFGPQSPHSAEKEAENTEAGLERTNERSGSASRTSARSQAWTATQSQITLRTKSMAEANQPSKQLPHDKLAGIQQIFKARNRTSITQALMVEAVPISSEQVPPKQPPLSRVLFTPSPTNGQVEKDANVTDFRRSKSVSKADGKMSRSALEAPMKRQKRGVTPEEQAAVRTFLLEEQANAEYRTKDLFAAVPELDPDNAAWDREAKIAEIKARPSRKARFTNNLTYARLERPSHTFFKEVDRPLPKAYKAPPPNRPGSGYSDHAVTDLTTQANGRRASLSNPDMNMQDAPYTQSSTTNGTSSSQFDLNRPEMFDTVEELLNLPSNLVPTLYEGRLAFRDGTVGANGRLPRAKKVFKVGRNVPGELK